MDPGTKTSTEPLDHVVIHATYIAHAVHARVESPATLHWMDITSDVNVLDIHGH